MLIAHRLSEFHSLTLKLSPLSRLAFNLSFSLGFVLVFYHCGVEVKTQQNCHKIAEMSKNLETQNKCRYKQLM